MGAKLKPEDQKIVEQVELIADATTATARRFVARVKERKGRLRTEGGRAITVREIAENLVKRTGLEHAVVETARPKSILCEDCGIPVIVPRKGPVPVCCPPCRNQRHYADRQSPKVKARDRLSRKTSLLRRGKRKTAVTEPLYERPKSIICEGCRVSVAVPIKGPVPVCCLKCTRKRHYEARKSPEIKARDKARRKARRAAKP